MTTTTNPMTRDEALMAQRLIAAGGKASSLALVSLDRCDFSAGGRMYRLVVDGRSLGSLDDVYDLLAQ